MEVETDPNPADIVAGINQEPEENQTTSNDSVGRIKNEPLEDQANPSSSITIIDSFTVPFDSANVTVKTENEKEDNTSTPTASGETASSSALIKVEIGILGESGNEETTSNSSKSVIPYDSAVKIENVVNTIKTENENASDDNNSLNSTTTLSFGDSGQVNPSPDGDGNAISKILTTSMPLTSASSSNCDKTDDISSSTDSQKPPCRYGKSCYRLNENHRKNFSHPPGSDPLRSPEKPRCKYGSRCYRKSEEHRKRFIHERSPDNAMSNTRKRKVRNVASQTTGHVYESDSDDDSYLYEEYDGSSDEFHPEDDDDTDSDETDFDDDTDEQILLNTA